ncbi:serine/threonine-protein kinase [Stigmatella sp. ncwal1]|uniref:Serine/threonine-protein kinase n=1 Tax=Stigmatella ashevillensis TaxID=2995309 RepID=A0ABT5DDA3_9BACT|nr:serine/threonine-protein kinase [Stigmatella ashevillena]MDC0711657.1 serine/threonine-protein kinase [Stigmatella ashevillena]
MTPDSLEPETRIGAWRVVSREGHGSYGAVYRVEPVEPRAGGPYALKLALHERDPRFEREAELLSRILHDSVPRLHARGGWEMPGGGVFPYVVMEWVEGESLYEWGARQARTSREVLRVLGQVARALEATHGEEGVHRDVKGDNIRVRSADGRAVLMDFGSCNYRRAPVLTRQPPPPGTPQYYSPESLRFQWESRKQPMARYEALPADDVYALGVTAYRLVAGRYPPEVELKQMEEGYEFVSPGWEEPERWGSLAPELAGLIRQMLSEEPFERGSASEVAEQLENAEKNAGPEADQPIGPRRGSRDEQAPAKPKVRLMPPRLTSPWKPWMGWAVGVCLAVGMGWMGGRLSVEGREGERRTDEKRVGLAEVARPLALDGGLVETGQAGVGLGMPKKPFPGQRRPPCGQQYEKEINGGCWLLPREAPQPPCGDNTFDWQGGCYVPVLELRRPSTSE